MIPIVQLLAFYLCIAKGYNPDKPKHIVDVVKWKGAFLPVISNLERGIVNLCTLDTLPLSSMMKWLRIPSCASLFYRRTPSTQPRL